MSSGTGVWCSGAVVAGLVGEGEVSCEQGEDREREANREGCGVCSGVQDVYLRGVSPPRSSPHPYPALPSAHPCLAVILA
ncbi:hypothetical protein E2C01_097990 [Portunus trituberculatus]|uniref:Uncharacterized protein n=1 Tax=Portunus trituberculatus TaxID=210409 RepID=A0A5B7K027_PORTR|nr:hypothetical protein [Portunus trituberculatus]